MLSESTKNNWLIAESTVLAVGGVVVLIFSGLLWCGEPSGSFELIAILSVITAPWATPLGFGIATWSFVRLLVGRFSPIVLLALLLTVPFLGLFVWNSLS